MSEVDLQTLQFEIVANADKATSSVDKLKGSLDKLSQSANFDPEKTGIKKLGDMVEKLRIDKLDYVIESLKGLKEVKFSGAASKNVEKFVTALDSLTADTVDKWKEIYQTLSNMPTIKLMSSRSPKNETSEGASAVKESGDSTVASGVEKIAEVAETADSRIGVVMGNIADKLSQLGKAGLDKIAERWSAALKKAGTAAKSFMKSIAFLPATIGKRLATSVKQTTASLGTFFSSIKRIAFYRLIRSALKALTQGFAEGQKNLYQYSKLMGTTFYQSMDKLSTESLYLKNSLAAMAAPLINAIAPAVEFVVDKIVTLFNWINKLISALTGAEVTTVAKRTTKAFDDAAERAGGSARKAADELKRTILAFDELNVLNDANTRNTGGGSGTNSDAEDYGAMFEEVEVDSYFKDLKERIETAFKASDWESLGRIIGGELNKLVDGIDAEGIGNKVGNAINGAIKTAYYFLDEVNFTNIGKKIMQFLDSAVASVEWEYVGGLPIKWVTSILDLILGALDEWKPRILATAISDFFIGAFKTFSDWIGDKDWLEIGKNLGQKIYDFLASVKWEEVITSVIVFVAEVLKALLPLAGGFLGAFFKDLFADLPDLLMVLGAKLAKSIWKALFKTFALDDNPLTKELYQKGLDGIDALIKGVKDGDLGTQLETEIKKYKGNLEFTASAKVDKKGATQFRKSFEKEIRKSPVSVLAEVEDNASKQYESYRRNIRTLTQQNPLTFNTDVVDDSVKLFDKTKRTWDNYTKNRPLVIGTSVSDNGAKMVSDTQSYYKTASAGKYVAIDTKVNNNGTQMVKDALTNFSNASSGKFGYISTKVNNNGTQMWNDTQDYFNKSKGDLTADVTVRAKNKISADDVFASNFKKEITIKPYWRKSTGSEADKAILNVFGLSKIPTFRVAAKGGIVDGATLFGGNVIAGEAGKEAIVPLERNTEWMDMVASKLQDDNEDMYASMYAALTDFYSNSMRSTMNQIAEDAGRTANKGESMMTANDITAALARKNLRDGRTVIQIG